jgi:rSAM/selenodomain-associated transferase 2
MLAGVGAGLVREVIVSDGGSRDDTKRIASAAGAVWLEGAKGRGAQLGAGAKAARGDWLLFVHADTHLPEVWPGAVSHHMQTRPDAAAAFRLAFRAEGIPARFTAWFANTRSKVFGLPFGDQALLISRVLYDQIGGYADQPLMEDVAIARALKGRLVLLEETVTTSAARYRQTGWMRRGVGNLVTQARYRLGTSPETLARRYHRD